MPLYIRDDDVAALARDLQRLTRVPTLTAAVGLALASEIERQKAKVPLAERLRKALALADAVAGPEPVREAPP